MPQVLSNMNALMDPRFVDLCCSPSLQRLFADCEKATHVDVSSIPGAGLGLFCSRNVPAGSLVSWYPVHALCINYADGGSTLLSMNENEHEWDHTDSAYSLNLLGNRPLIAGWDLDSGDKVLVDADPLKSTPLPWQAHRINDGSLIRSNTLQAVQEYYHQAFEKMNVAMVSSFGPSPICVAVTTRDVRQGEELFTPYGYSYWMARFARNNETLVEKTDTLLQREQQIVHQVEICASVVNIEYQAESDELHDHFKNLVERSLEQN